MKRNLVILRGVSGSGKSTFVEKLKTSDGSLVHCSADFIHVGQDGNYNFDPAKLGLGHKQCFRATIDAMVGGADLIVIDNTNTTLVELAPYVQLGFAMDYKVHLVRIYKDVESAAARNIHGLTEDQVDGMARRFQTPLARWPKEHFFEDPTDQQVADFYRGL